MILKVPLTPIQSWFLNEKSVDHNSLVQTVMLDAQEYISYDKLNEALDKLVLRYHEFSMRFVSCGQSYEQFYDDSLDTSKDFLLRELTFETRKDLNKFKDQSIFKIDITKGPLINVYLCNFLDDSRQNILIVVHHLIIEGEGWNALIESLESIYLGKVEDDKSRVNITEVKYVQWANWINSQERTERFKLEAGFWSRILSSKSSFPEESSMDAKTPVKNFRPSRLEIDVKDTNLIAGSYYGIECCTVASIIESLLTWKNSDSLTIALGYHNRKFEGDVLDLEAQLGWFTSIYPLNFSIKNQTDTGSFLSEVSSTLSQAPIGGLGYGFLMDILRYDFGVFNPPKIIINNLGERRIYISPHGLFKYGKENQRISMNYEHPYFLDIDFFIYNSNLVMEWNYDKNQFSDGEIDLLTASTKQNLLRIANLEKYKGEEVGNYD